MLNQRKKIFEAVCSTINTMHTKNADVEQTCLLIESLGRFAFRQYPDYFVSEKIELIIKEIGEKILKDKNVTTKHPSKHHILHICSHHYEIGGHSKLLENWIQFGEKQTHSVLITNNANNTIYNLSRLCNASNGDVYICKNTGYSDKIIEIFDYINNSSFSHIIFHTHPEEIVAFAATLKFDIPKFFVNHADHGFWFGKHFADYFINIRTEAANINKFLRGIDNNLLLQLPVREFSYKKTKTEARTELKINQNVPVAISVGNYHKFIPDSTNTFNKLLTEIWKQIPELQIYLIGVNQAEASMCKFVNDNRLVLCGQIEDPSNYYTAADFVIDPIPKGSYTATLEAASFGCYPILYKNGVKLFDLAEDISLKDFVKTKSNIDDLVKEMSFLIKENEDLQKKSEVISGKIIQEHSKQYLSNTFSKLINGNLNNLKINEYQNANTNEYNDYLSKLNNPTFTRDTEVLFYHLNICRNKISLKKKLSLLKLFWNINNYNSKGIKLKTFTKFILN
ncbi:MAG: hypothetical protein PHE56_10965 [Bacteroidales bacterium]|nr:hypothetical protein [Bacteroidales bacterium]